MCSSLLLGASQGNRIVRSKNSKLKLVSNEIELPSNITQ